MKKSDNRGFMLAETLIVASFISITLIYLFVQFRNINNNYSTSIMYNNVNGMYINNEIKKFISQYNMENISMQIAYSDKGYYDLVSCDASIFNDSSYCIEFFSRLNIKKSIYTFESIDVVSSDFTDEFNKYLNSIRVPNSTMYVIATEFNDGSFASIKLTGYQYPTLEDRIKSQTVVTAGSGLYNNTTVLGENFVFKGNSAELNNYIDVGEYQGRIIEINNQGIKAVLEKEPLLQFDDKDAFYSSDGFLTVGSYLSNSNLNSSLFSSLNRLCSDCKGLVKNATWNVGEIEPIIGNTYGNIVEEEKRAVYQGSDTIGYVGTVSVSDIIKTSINASCNLSGISNSCLLNNWLSGNVWTFNASTTTTVWSIENNIFVASSITNSKDTYPVIYLSKNVKAVGEGTIDNPYKVL